MIVPGYQDRVLKSGRWRGHVHRLLGKGKREVIAYVYGETSKEMRHKKRLVCDALRVDEGLEPMCNVEP